MAGNLANDREISTSRKEDSIDMGNPNYEFRTYTLHPGRFEAFKQRFLEVSLRFFEKHGIQYCGFCEIARLPEHAVPQVSPGGIVRQAKGTRFNQDEVAYPVAFESVERRDRAWLDFVADEEWRRLKAESEADGSIVKDEASFLLQVIAR